MAEFSIETRQGDRSTLTAAGEIDIASVDEFIAAARTCLHSGAPVFAVDFGGVEFIDSSGLGALVRLRKEAEERDVRLELVDVPRSVARLLTVTGLDELFPDPTGD